MSATYDDRRSDRTTVTKMTPEVWARYDALKDRGIGHNDIYAAGLAALESGPAAEPATVVIEVGPELAGLLRALARPDGGQHERPRHAPPTAAERLDGQHRALWDAYSARDRIAVADVRAVLGCGWTTASRIMAGLVVSGRATAHPKPMGGAWTWTLRPPADG